MNSRARCLLLVAAVIVAGMSLGLRGAPADELPEDTTKIERLTPERARRLAQEFPGVTFEIVMQGQGRHLICDCLPLN